MKTISLIVCFFCAAFSMGQQLVTPHPLYVGDVVPDFTFNDVRNFNRQSFRLSDIEKDLIIFDFWTSFCAPCIAKFPTLDSLQHEYNNRVQFLPIDWEHKERFDKFVSRITAKHNYLIPFLYDTTVYNLFMNNEGFLGQYIWIKEGKIIALTSGKDVNRNNIDLVLSGRQLPGGAERKNQRTVPNDFKHSYLLEQGNTQSIKSHSVITGFLSNYKSGYYTGSIETSPESISGFRFINWPLFGLYQEAYEIHAYDVVFDVHDSRMFDESYADTAGLFCYESIVPFPSTIAELRKNLQSDLARGFPYVVTKQKRIVDCAVLKKIPGAKLHTSGKAPDLASSGLNIFIQNGPISNLTLWIEKICKVNGPRYVIDETGIDYNVDLDIVLYEPADVNPSMVIAELKKIGLELSIEKREKEIWVISDRRADK